MSDDPAHTGVRKDRVGTGAGELVQWLRVGISGVERWLSS